MSYSEQELFRLIKKANSFFKRAESSLGPVLDAMELPRPQQVAGLRQAINGMTAAKQLKYRDVLAYIEMEYANDNLFVPQPPTPRGLRTEYKIGWKEAHLLDDTVLVHCTGAPPASVMIAGIDPEKSREWCIPSAPQSPQWQWNRFAFLFTINDDDFPPKKAEQFGFGAGGYIYVVRVPKYTTFMNQNGTIGPNKEIGFPEVIDPQHIIGLFQYKTGDQETPKRHKMEYSLYELSLQAPYNVVATHQGSNSNQSALPSSSEMVRQVLNL